MSDPPDNKLHRPVEEWPLLLLGPMLRRVTEDSVSVFVALSARVGVTLKVFSAPDATGEEITRSVPSNARVVSIGERLHVCVATAFGVFEPGHLYGYDIVLGSPEDGSTLGDFDLLGPPVPIGYQPGWLPSFLLPPGRRDLKLVQASCRKPHGCHRTKRLTDPDALPLVDRLIADNLEAAASRPQQLILTGDQIYSDDVPAAMLAAATSLGRQLLGWAIPETFPDRTGIDTIRDDHPRVDPGERSKFLADQAVKDRASSASAANRGPLEILDIEEEDDEPLEGGNWEDYAANHLLFFSEWCAMYLLAWSPVLWLERDAVDPGDRRTDPNRSTYYLPSPTGYWKHSPDTTTPALIYAENLPFVRRALANVATYTAIDDHDVTDDWFLNGKVDELLRKGRLEDNQSSGGGRRLMRNALVAYSVFQHWGNVPGEFGSGTPGGDLLDLLDIGPSVDLPDPATPPIGRPGQEDDADPLLDVGPEPVGADRADERIRWDYEVLLPEHRLLVLDTRSWRGFPDAVVDLSAADIVAAGEQRLPPPAGRGTAELHGLAAAWASAAVTAANAGEPVLGDLLGAGAAGIEHAAALAEAVETGAAGWQQHANGVIDDARTLLVSVGDTTAVQDLGWAVAAAAAAAAKLLAEWDEAVAAADVRGETLRAAGSLDAAALVLQADVPGVLARFSAEGIESSFDAAAAGLWRTGELLRALAWFLRWAAVSPGQTARANAPLASAWVALGGDLAPVLFPAADPDAIAAVDQAAVASATLRQAFAAVEREWDEHVDPVWDFLVGTGTTTLNAELISADALQFMVVDRLAQPLAERPLTLVVSPAPVFDHPLVFFLIRLAIATDFSRQAAAEWENEPWGGNPRALHRLLEALSVLESAVILSGDVHYACSSVHDYEAPGGRRARFVQLTSSSAKNSWEPSTALARADKATSYRPADVYGFFAEFIDKLPTIEERAEWDEQIEDLAPSWENAVQLFKRVAAGAAQELEELGDGAQRAGELLFEPIDLGAAADAVKRKQWDVTDQAKLLGHKFHEYRQSPWHIHELLYTFPLASEQLLLMLHELGVDVAKLPRARSTRLQDLRGEARIGDSPGLAAAIEEQASSRRLDILTGEARTVGRANIGLVRFESIAGVGDTVVHDIYSFPVDSPARIEGLGPPPPETSFRDDWIITRHAAALAFGAPADVGTWGTQ